MAEPSWLDWMQVVLAIAALIYSLRIDRSQSKHILRIEAIEKSIAQTVGANDKKARRKKR